MTPEQAIAIASARMRMAQGNVASGQNSAVVSPAEQFQEDHPLARTIGRAGRVTASGLSSLADIGLLVPKTAALGSAMVADKMGATDLAQFLQRVGSTPSMSDTSKGIIDQATGDKLKPANTIDKIGDFAGELVTSAIPFSKSEQALNAVKSPAITDAVTATLNPQKAAERVFINKYPAPEKITADIIKARASEAYKTAREKGGVLKSETVDRFLDNLQTKVKPQDELAQALSKDDPSNEVLDVLEKMARGKEMDLDRLQALDEVLSNKIDKHIEFGRPKKEALGLMKIQDELRNVVESAGEGDIVGSKEGFQALKEGRKLWAKAAKLRDVERIITRAEMSEQPANAMKAGFKTLYNNPNRMRGFSSEEKRVIRRAAQSGVVGELLRGPASRLTGIISGSVGGPAGYLGGKTVEMAARGAGAALQAKRASALADLIAKTPQEIVSQPLLTSQGNLAAIAGTNSMGQMLLPKPQESKLIEFSKKFDR